MARAGARGRAGALGWFLSLWAVAAAGPAPADVQGAPGPVLDHPDPEVPLGNPAILPVDAALLGRVFAGDQAFRAFLEEGAEGAMHAAIDHWHGALRGSAPGVAIGFVPAPERAPRGPGAIADVDGRRAEGIEAAILRRLKDAGPRARGMWRERLEARAGEELGAARGGPSSEPADPAARALVSALERVERDFPGTLAAFRAGLSLSDLASAEGRPLGAATWLARAAFHRELLDLGPASGTGALDEGGLLLDRALERRRAALVPLGSPAQTTAPWDSARQLELAAVLALPDPFAPPRSDHWGGMGRGLQPGLGITADGRAVVQHASRVFVLGTNALAVELSFEPSAAISAHVGEPTLPFPPPLPPGWTLKPAVQGRSVVLVEGRATPRSTSTNAILRLDLPEPLSELGPPATVRSALATLAWVVRGDRHWPERADVDPGARAELHTAELQPAPLWIGECVLVQGRRGEGEWEGLVFALSAADGAVLWSKVLVRGGERGPGAGRFAGVGLGQSSAAAPVASRDGLRVLLGTHLGSLSLVDALDGRLQWTLIHQREPGNEPTWSGAPPVALSDGFLAAPVDSGLLYRLPDGPMASGDLWEPPLAGPLPRGEGLELVGSHRGGAVLVARAGSRQTLRWLAPDGREEREGVYLAPGEEVRGGALVGSRRAALSSDRALWLFDLENEFYLLAEVPLPAGPLEERISANPGSLGPQPRRLGGSVHGLGVHIAVLEQERLLVFRVRP